MTRARVGISVYDMPARDYLTLARSADELGFDSLWLGEHLVVPASVASAHPAEEGAGQDAPVAMDLGSELHDTWALVGAALACTTRLKVATGVYITPLRHPLITARASITAHELSGGRFTLGLGAGWLREEFDALGVPFKERMSRLEESIDVLKAAWSGEPLHHSGRHFSFAVEPMSPRRVDIPLVLGGNAPRALMRAAQHGDGWIASATPSISESLEFFSQVRRHREAAHPGSAFRCLVRVAGADPAEIQEYSEAGIPDVIVRTSALAPSGDINECTDAMARLAKALHLDKPLADA